MPCLYIYKKNMEAIIEVQTQDEILIFLENVSIPVIYV